MKAIHWIIAAAALAFVQPAPVQAAVGDPEIILYRFSGVTDDGLGDFNGVATALHCTNFSGVPERLRIVIRHRDSRLLQNVPFTVPHLATLTAATKAVVVFDISPFLFTNLATGAVPGGTAAIAATSASITCTAMIVNAGALGGICPTCLIGVSLQGIRFNPIPGAQE